NILKHPYMPWQWAWVSMNPNITMKDVLATPDKGWDWRWLSKNPRITMKDVLSHPDKNWNWWNLSVNTFRWKNKKEIIKNNKLLSIFLNKNTISKYIKMEILKIL